MTGKAEGEGGVIVLLAGFWGFIVEELDDDASEVLGARLNV